MAEKLDDALKEALQKRAEGYYYEEKTIIAGSDGKPERVQVKRRHVPPSLQAIRQIRYLQHIGKW